MLCDPQGVQLAELGTATGRTLSFQRNSYSEASLVVSHDDDAAALLLSCLRNAGIPTLKCIRKGVNDAAGVLRLRGYLAGLSEVADDASSLTAVFRGPFARLLGDGSDRGRFSTLSSFTATDAGQIAKQLLDAANTDGFTGLATTGTIQATKTRDRLYTNANIGEAIVNLTRVLDGFDFEEVYVDQGATLATFNVYAGQGSDRPGARFEYGPATLGNVRSVARITQQPINSARVLGAGALIGLREHAASIAKYGKWPIQQTNSDVIEQTTLDDKAQALLRPNPVKTITFVPDLSLSPLPWDDFWIGDTIRFYASRGAFTEDLAVRVNGITILIDDNGLETTDLHPEPLEVLEADPAQQAYQAAAAAAQQATADAASSITVEVVDGASV